MQLAAAEAEVQQAEHEKVQADALIAQPLVCIVS
jgi:hypothetical protein